MTDWQHKLVKTENLDVETLLQMAHPENAREHPDHQLEATEELIDAIGLIDEIKVSVNSGKIINGHARIQIALQSGQTSLPVNWYDLTEDEERLALEQYDATTYEATYNPDKLRALMEKTKGIKADRPSLQALMERLKAREGIDGNGLNGQRQITRSGRMYNAGEGHDIEPFKLAYRIEAAHQADNKLALDLFSGEGQLASWYSRRFERVITVDKNFSVGDVDYSMPALDFINNHLSEYLDFDFVDFDHEGTPALEIQALFKAISGHKHNPFVLCLTDGNGMNLKFHGLFDFGKYYLVKGESQRRATREDYDNFEDLVTGFVCKCSEGTNFTPTRISTYRGREGNAVYQTWLMEPS